MHFPMKIQPLDADSFRDSSIRVDSGKPVLKTRLKRLLRIYEKGPVGAESEFEPSSIGLDKMVQSFIEDSNNNNNNDKKISKNRCYCFNGNGNNDSSDDEFDEFDSPVDSSDLLKGLIQCGSKRERDLLADTSKIVEKNKGCKRKDDLRQIVTVGLVNLGYDASICKSRWDKSPSHPAGEYEYIDVIIEQERAIIDVDFPAEFEIARSTSTYKSVLQSLPHIFVGGCDRLHQIVSIVSEAAKQSLKKKGMHIPPWRKAEYMRAKWLSPHTRVALNNENGDLAVKNEESNNEVSLFASTTKDSGVGVFATTKKGSGVGISATKTKESATGSECGDFALIFKEEAASVVDELAGSISGGSVWQPPEIKKKSCERGGAKVVVTGLACLLREKP